MFERIKAAADKLGCVVEGFCLYTNPGDKHLAVVLCRREDDEMVCWVYNDQTQGFIWGRYHHEARPAFVERVQWYCTPADKETPKPEQPADEPDEHCSVCDKPYTIDDNDKPGSPRWEGFCSVECQNS